MKSEIRPAKRQKIEFWVCMLMPMMVAMAIILFDERVIVLSILWPWNNWMDEVSILNENNYTWLADRFIAINMIFTFCWLVLLSYFLLRILIMLFISRTKFGRAMDVDSKWTVVFLMGTFLTCFVFDHRFCGIENTRYCWPATYAFLLVAVLMYGFLNILTFGLLSVTDVEREAE